MKYTRFPLAGSLKLYGSSLKPNNIGIIVNTFDLPTHDTNKCMCVVHESVHACVCVIAVVYA